MPSPPHAAIIGGGPSGLMAAEVLAEAGYRVTVFERKSAPGRKFLLAGRGGLNLTHSEDFSAFLARYGAAAEKLRPALHAFPPAALRAWCEGLGEETFVGSSGRIFPKSFKASPLLRAWRARLKGLGVEFSFNQTWEGWDGDALLLNGRKVKPDVTLLALGGASWPRLGSDGSWAGILERQGIPVSPLRPANCGFHVAWSDAFRKKAAGQPLKPVSLTFGGRTVQGEAMLTEQGIEGGAVYALSGTLRDAIERQGHALLTLDLRPGVSDLAARLAAPRGALSFSNFLRRAGGLTPVAAALVREAGGAEVAGLPPDALARLIKALPLRLEAPFSIDRAISSAGGVKWDAVDERFMLLAKPGVFVAGEMLDWEAPTGGYLLQACFSTAVHAAKGACLWLESVYKTR